VLAVTPRFPKYIVVGTRQKLATYIRAKNTPHAYTLILGIENKHNIH